MGIKGREGITSGFSWGVPLIADNNLPLGKDLDEKWTEGVSTHLGMMVNGFPNMFFVCQYHAPPERNTNRT
jgi:cation diffusion facilitator CzcD-associated flavoprotein CzcO